MLDIHSNQTEFDLLDYEWPFMYPRTICNMIQAIMSATCNLLVLDLRLDLSLDFVDKFLKDSFGNWLKDKINL